MRVAYIDFDLANFALTIVIETNNVMENEGKFIKNWTMFCANYK